MHITNTHRSQIYGLTFFTPAGLVVLLGFLFPLVRIVSLALRPDDIWSISNITKVFSDETLAICIMNSLTFVIISTIAHLLLGLFFANILNMELNPRFVKIARSIMIIPWAISPVVVATIFRLLYHPELSIFSSFYKATPTFSQGILSSDKYALIAVIVINIWYATPFYFLLFLARMQSIPKEIYEASTLDGASYFTSLKSITIPILKPLIVTLGIYDIVAAFNTFDLIWLTTMGGPGTSTEVLATYIYRVAFRDLNFSYASAMGLVLLVLIIGICGLLWLSNRKKARW